MCPLLFVCPSQGIYQANSVDVHVSAATQKKIPLAAREMSGKEFMPFYP